MLPLFCTEEMIFCHSLVHTEEKNMSYLDHFLHDVIDYAVPDPKGKKQKLECVASFQLFGNVESMQNVRLTGPRDALLLSFKEARVSPTHNRQNLACV